MQIFFKMANFKCLIIEKGCIHPPHPLTLTAYPTPGKGGTPIFFMKMTAKDVKEITYMPLVTFFSVLERPGKNRKGVATTPLVRRGLNLTNLHNPLDVFNLKSDIFDSITMKLLMCSHLYNNKQTQQ